MRILHGISSIEHKFGNFRLRSRGLFYIIEAMRLPIVRNQMGMKVSKERSMEEYHGKDTV